MPSEPEPKPGARATRRRDLLASAGWLALWSGIARAAPAPPTVPGAALARTTGLDAALLEQTLARAAGLPNLHALLVSRDGAELVGRVFRGPGLDRPVNVKSVSKSVIAALAGSAIARGVLQGVDQRIAPLLDGFVPADADPRVALITVDHLLTMRAGLERTSGRNYGRWVASDNWIRYALARPFVDEPGGRMLYSTGSYHLLSAALTRAAGSSTLALARDWLGEPLGIDIPPWTRDPQGFYLGGNNMLLAPRALLRLGELYRLGGVYAGRRVMPGSWIEASWTPRVRSPFTGHTYGYGWFIARARGHLVAYAWGYGGQMIYVVPDLALTVVMTSDATSPSGRSGYVRQLHGLLAEGIVAAAERGAARDGA
ncbi:MAG TPA: serine hydrolase [Geminicoccaceae bacterium]|nr:serine hydrolase [Geminicoccaceae bacterium]